MNINVNFNDEQCSTLLNMQGYVVEEVTLYYNPDTDPYENDSNPSEFRGINYKVAYKAGYKPEVLCKEKPLVSECMDYMYNKVLDSLISNWLYHVMLKNEPHTW